MSASLPRLCHEFLNLCQLYHAASPPFSLRSRQRAIDAFRKTIFRPYWQKGSGSIPGINPCRSRWTVATLHPISRAVSLGLSQSRASAGGSGGLWRVCVRVALARPFGCSNAMGVSILFPFCPWLGQFQFGLQTVGESLQTRSEERRVGKECRSRWSPY